MTMELQDGDDRVPQAVDYGSHKRQFDRFVHLVKWFAIHVIGLLASLYFFLIAGQTVTGVVLLALALGALGYGILSTPQVARDVNAAVGHYHDLS